MLQLILIENSGGLGHRVLAVDPMAENLAYIHKSLGNIKYTSRIYFYPEHQSNVLSAGIVRNLWNCNGNSIYVFLSLELRGLSPNFHIHVSVSYLYIPRIGPHISLQKNMQTDPGNI